jgi:PST family polysaccharide transporter
LVLGSVAPLAALGEYAGAERITRVFQQGMWPVNQALYPRLAQEAQNSPGRARKTVRLSMLFLGGLGLVFGATIFFAAPLMVHIVLGPAFQDSIPVLRVFALWIPLIALSTAIIFQLLLPNQLDHQFNFVNLTAGLTGICAAIFLTPLFGAVGIAWATVIAQLYTLLAFFIILGRAGLNPFVPPTPSALRRHRLRKLTPVLAPALGNQEMKLRLRTKMAEAERLAQVQVTDPQAVGIPIPYPPHPQGIGPKHA